MNASPRFFDGAEKMVDRLRRENGGLPHLSDWQVYSANLVSSSITRLAFGLNAGPLYVPMPTGSGKTTGAMWGIVKVIEENPDERICFLTQYRDAVDRVYAELAAKLGDHRVGRYHGEADVDKEAELAKQVVVLTHQFVPANKGRLGDRTLFIIDEAIFATGEATVKLSQFAAARAWATTNNIYPQEFVKLLDFAHAMDKQIHDGARKYVAASADADLSFAKTIAEKLHLPDHAQTIENMELLSSVQLFCEALLQGTAFLARSETSNNKYDPVFYAAVLGLPNLEKTVVLTATGGLTYDVAGRFKVADAVSDYWVQPSYQNLRLVNLSGPTITTHYKKWSKSAAKGEVIAYVDWVLRTVSETKVYLTLPKQVLEGCLLDYFAGGTGGKGDYPLVVELHGKTVNVSHHSLSIGSNQFRECDAVIYLFDNYKPQALSIQRYHALTGQPVTEAVLEAVAGGRLTGDYKKIKEATYLENIMQQIGRGTIRTFDDQAVAHPMTAYVFTQQAGLFHKLADQYRGCQRQEQPYQGVDARAPSGRVDRIIHYIRQNGAGRDVPVDEAEKALGLEIRRVSSDLERSRDLETLGYKFIRGSRGRGKQGMFRKVTEQQN